MSRRASVFVCALSLVASCLGIALVPASAGALAAIAPGDTPDTGNLYVTPDPVSVGQTVKLTANFPSGSFDVTFYERTGPETWTSIGSDPSNAQGNSYLYTHVVDGDEELYARITSGGEGRTEVKTVTPIPADVIAPSGPDVASLYQDPATFADGDRIKITANFPNGTFPVTLYRETAENVWTEVATDQSNSSGNAYFYDYEVDGTQRLFARKANNERSEVGTLTPAPETTLSIQRNCSGSSCDSTATALAELDPAQPGWVVRLQYKSGSSWRSIGTSATTDADGTARIRFSLAGVSQWSTRTYRLTVAASGSSSTLTSNQVKFMPGPTQLGANVLRIDVEDGIFPTTKGPEYAGHATLSTDGIVSLDDVELEDFGVRGSSTSGYVKKPYKLKFEDSPSDTGVFGMEADKSWTLLAGYVDRSLVREKVALDLARQMTNLPWTPDSRYVELFVNDQYMGAYLMTESVKIDGDRVDVHKEQGMIMETDGTSVSDPDLGFRSSEGIVFAFKDPDEVKDGGADPEGVTPAKLDAIRTRINAFETKLYSSATRSQYPDFIDVPSTIDYYLIKEFTKDLDSDFYRSDYFSWDPSGRPGKPLSDGKFHFGPAWDFDRSAGADTDSSSSHAYAASPSGFYIRGTGTDSGHGNYRTHWFVQLFKDTAFKNAVEARWDVVKGVFAQADAEAQAAADELGPGADNDRRRWSGQPRRYKARASTAAGEVDWVEDWYADRYTWMNNNM